MEDLSLEFTFKNEPVMALDNPAQRLEMKVPLTGLSSISLAQGIDLARAVWKAFNPTGDDIAPYITSVAESQRYRIKRTNDGIVERQTNNTKKGVFSVQVDIPTMGFLKGVQSDKINVKVTPPPGLYREPPNRLLATMNTSKVFAPQKSPLTKLIEIGLRALATPTAAARKFAGVAPSVAPSETPSGAPSETPSEPPSEPPSETPSPPASSPSAASENSLPQTSSEGRTKSEGTAEPA